MIVTAGRYEVVLFDVDDTLMDHRGAANDALQLWARDLGIDMDAVELAAAWQLLERRYYDLYQRGELTKSGQRRARIRAMLERPDLTDRDADALFEIYWTAYCAAWRVFPDAVDAVRRALGAGHRVGLLTNGEARDQQRKVEATVLAEFGLPMFASSELPAAKPHRKAFESACNAMDVVPSRCLMVGDSLANDVEGALNAGLSAVLLDRSGAKQRVPDGYGLIGSLDQLRFD